MPIGLAPLYGTKKSTVEDAGLIQVVHLTIKEELQSVHINSI